MDATDISSLTDQFVREMDRLGPFEPCPRLAIAVSGGADSMALALLAQYWAMQRAGEVLALTVDHGLRAESSTDSDVALRRLASRGISGRKLTVPDLAVGPALAERAREARYRALLDACAAHGIAHLLLGHHRGDQVETLMMRALSSSAARGLAGMPALLETRFVRLLRPLLNVAPERLRQLLTVRGVAWGEDPSNRDAGALRARLRQALADPSGMGEGTQAVAHAAHQAGIHRAARDRHIAQILAERATIRPEGHAVLTPGPIDPEALAALLRTVAGAPHAPRIDRVALLARGLWLHGDKSDGRARGDLARNIQAGGGRDAHMRAGLGQTNWADAGHLRPGFRRAGTTLGGVRIVPAGRLGPGWLLVRERRAMEGAVAASLNVVWDGRFRLTGAPPDGFAPGLVIGALGSDAARFRNRGGPPALVLHGLPALRLDGIPIAVPHIGVGDSRWRLIFDPRNHAAGAPFLFG